MGSLWNSLCTAYRWCWRWWWWSQRWWWCWKQPWLTSQPANSLKRDECIFKNCHPYHLFCFCCGFLFSQQVFACSFFHISQLHISFIDLWASFWHWKYCNRWVFYWVSDNSTSWICDRISSAFLSFSCKIMTMTFFVKTTIWVIALSFCDNHDNFCQKIGKLNHNIYKLWG